VVAVMPAILAYPADLAHVATLVSDGVSDLASRDEIGTAVATDGFVAVVGAPFHDLGGDDAGAAFVYRLEGGEWIEDGRLVAADAAAGAAFGSSAAVSDNVIVVGAPWAGGEGAAYVFQRDGGRWLETARIEAPAGAEGDAFGWAVALDDGLLVVGAPRTDDGPTIDSGAAHVYARSGDSWIHESVLLPSAPVASGRFGWSVATTGETIAVGATRSGATAPAAGSVTVFTNTGGWSEEQVLVGSDTATGDRFGSSVDVGGDVLVVGAPGAGGSGAGYVFQRSDGSWLEGARLTPATGSPGDDCGLDVALLEGAVALGSPAAGAGGRVTIFAGGGSSWQEADALGPTGGGSGSSFGRALGFANGTLVVGAPTDDAMGDSSGVAWLFEGSGSSWDDGIRLPGSGTAAFDLFGLSVALDGDTAVVGAPAEDVGSIEEAGAVYVYVRAAGSWIRQARLVASNPSRGAQLGTDVAISGDIIVAGAWLADSAADDGGMVYVFERAGDGWTETAKLAPTTLEPDDYYGRSVAVSGDTIAAAAAGGSTVYVHRRSGGVWALEDVLDVFPKHPYPLLLAAVDVSEDVLVVGAQADQAAYVFQRNGATWSEAARVVSPSGQDEDFFGYAVSVDGDTAAVAAPLENVAGQLDAGAVYLFRGANGTWALDGRLQSPTPTLEDAFGVGLDLTAGRVAVGAPFNRLDGPRPGYAVIFERGNGNWSAVSVIGDPADQGGAQFGSSAATGPGTLLVGAWSTDRPPGTPDQGAAYVFGESQPATSPPRARITWIPAAPASGETIQFIDASAGSPATWHWDLGDGSTSSDPNPIHAFAQPGRYEVALVVDNAFGQDHSTATVVVRDLGDPSFEPTSVVAAVARVEGSGAFFSSRFEMFNAGSDDVLVDAVYTPRDDIGGPARVTSIALPAGVQLEVDDPLGAWFGLAGQETGVGSLMLRVLDGDPASLLTYSVVFARNPDGSEFGQLFPAVAGSGGIASGQSAVMASTSDAAHNRVNVGAMALEGGTRVRFVPVDPLGAPLATARVVELGLGGSRQINNVHQTFGLDPSAEDFLLEAQVLSGRAVAYASVVDGVGGNYPGTNDPTTILPVLGSERTTLIALGPVSGLNEFSGSASITNLGDDEVVVSAAFFARDDGAGGPSETAVVTLGAGDTVGYRDLVGELFGVDGVGTVVLEGPPGSSIAATGREFSLLKAANGTVIGRAGQLIRGLRDSETLVPGAVSHFLGLRQIDASPVPERSNIVAFNPGGEAVRLTLRLHDAASGTFEGEQSYLVPALDLRQVNLVISKINPDQDGDVKRIEATVDGPLFVQAVRANRDGDPVTIDPLPPPGTR
jgi:PKD repeat protein